MAACCQVVWLSVLSFYLTADFKPSINPPKEIDDPEDSKPEDWIDEVRASEGVCVGVDRGVCGWTPSLARSSSHHLIRSNVCDGGTRPCVMVGLTLIPPFDFDSTIRP